MEGEITIKESDKISILLVDDSLVFRRFLEDIFQDYKQLEIIGEASNGIEALELMLKTLPDVILLDLEMPIMDGMTALQHLMIHRPIPVIMFSSITEEGTARCFDTMKNGAVDFICKDFIFQQHNIQANKRIIVDKVRNAARMNLRAREPVFSSSSPLAIDSKVEERVIFCEECGKKEVVAITNNRSPRNVRCSNCGDELEIQLFRKTYSKHNNFITILGGGEGSFQNILQIVPRLDPDLEGTIVAVIHGDASHVDSFTEYLDAISEIKVVRGLERTSLETGKCYIVSGADNLSIQGKKSEMKFRKVQNASIRSGTLDLILASAATLFLKQVIAVFLSGDIPDGEKGAAILGKYKGYLITLASNECLKTKLIDNISKNHDFGTVLPTDAIVDFLITKHS